MKRWMHLVRFHAWGVVHELNYYYYGVLEMREQA